MTIAPLDIVAAGARASCAAMGQQSGFKPDAAICTSCGTLTREWSGACRACGQHAVPLLEHITPNGAVAVPRDPGATLTLVGAGSGTPARPLEGDFFRLGATPLPTGASPTTSIHWSRPLTR